MRHGKKINHLSRKTAHRRLMLANMATSLIAHKRISTTVAKAKALRKYVEPLITKSKDNTTHSRRTVFSYLQDKESINKLFGEVASRVGERPGGYTRIIKMGATRLGDNADMCMMELVDFNDLYKKESRTDKAKPKTRRSRRTKKETTPKGATDTTAESTSTEPTSAEPTTTESTSAEPTVKKDDDMPHDDTIAQPDEDKEA